MAEMPIVTGVLGYLFGQQAGQPPQQWQQLQENVQERLSHLTYMDIKMPFSFYDRVDNGEPLHAETLGTFLLGYSNASVPMSFRCLETGLSQKYKMEEGKDPSDMSAYDLLEHFEDEFGDQLLPLHWFRRMRNKIHTTEMVEEADTLEAIRHTTEALNEIFAKEEEGVAWGVRDCCGRKYEMIFDADVFYLGNVINIECDSCQQVTPHRVLPQPVNEQI